MMLWLKRLNLCDWRGALAAVLMVRLVWSTWAAAMTAALPDMALSRALPLLPAPPLSGARWPRAPGRGRTRGRAARPRGPVLPLLPARPLGGAWWHRALVWPWMRFDFEYYEAILTGGYST